MHLFSFANEEDKEIGLNKCIIGNLNSIIIFLVESLFCPMTRLSTSVYSERWKSLPKTSEHKFVIGKLYTNKEPNVIKRLQAHNIVPCTFKTIDKTTIIYLACTTRDNILILTEFTLVNSDFLYGKIKYKSENHSREMDFENYMALILSSGEQEIFEEAIGR